MRRGEQKPSDLDRPEGNSLLENYEAHDVGEEWLIEQLESRRLTVEPWGIDMRHDDGDDGIIFDNKMDLKVFDHDGNLAALVDVKTKRSPRYMGRFNERHYEHYSEHAETFDVPCYVVFCQIGPNPDAVGDTVIDSFAAQIGNGHVLTRSNCEAVGSFPDGNGVALVQHAGRGDVSQMIDHIRHVGEP
jgi:hypothetical protein